MFSNRASASEEVLSTLNCFFVIVFVTMVIAGSPSYYISFKNFYKIFKNGQPFYICLLILLAVSAFSLLFALVDAIGFWVSLPACQLIGSLRTFTVITLSLLVAFVCIYRSIAVSSVILYKKVNRVKVLLGGCLAILGVSAFIAILMNRLEITNFKYLGPPSYIGCTPVLTKGNKFSFVGYVFFSVMVCDILLLLTYAILHKKLHKPSMRPSMKRLKESARMVSLIITVLYIVLHLPLFVVYMLVLVNSGVVEKIKSESALLVLDFTIRFMSYLYSAVLPSIIVRTGSLNKTVMIAARQSIKFTS